MDYFEENEAKDFSRLLKEAREAAGMSVRELADKTREKDGKGGICYTLITLIEKGLRLPTYEVAYSLAVGLDIDVQEALEAAYESRIRYCIYREKYRYQDFTNKERE